MMATTLIQKRKHGADPSKLTACEQKFVAELLAAGDWNLANAVRKAYPKCKYPGQYGNELVKRPRIKAILGKIQREDAERLELKREEILKHLYYMVTANRIGLFDDKGIMILNHRVVNGEVVGSTVHDLPIALQQCINGVKQRVKRYETEDGEVVEEVYTEVQLVPKEKAQEMAMKHQGLFAPEQQVVTLKPDWDALYRDNRDDPNEIEGEVLKRIANDAS